METYRDLPVIRHICTQLDNVRDVVAAVEVVTVDGTLTRPAFSLEHANGFIVKNILDETLCIIRDDKDLIAILWVLLEKTSLSVALDLKAARKVAGRTADELGMDLQILHDNLCTGQETFEVQRLIEGFKKLRSHHAQIEALRRLKDIEQNPSLCHLFNATKLTS